MYACVCMGKAWTVLDDFLGCTSVIQLAQQLKLVINLDETAC